MKKVCITGVAGFVGSNLVEACLDLGWHVVGVDSFATGHKEMVNPMRFNSRPGKFSFISGDINDEELYRHLDGVDVIFHLAALPRVQYSTDYPVNSHHNNITGTLNILEAARKAGVKRVVYSASSSMYGGQDIQFPTPETTPARPRSNYALQKYTSAEYCRMYSELYGLDTVSLIYFNLMGRYQRADSSYATVIPAFFAAGISGNQCRIDGEDGAQSRDFCSIENAVRANILAALSDKTFAGDMFNIACGEHYSVMDVFDMVKSLLKIPLKKYHVAARLGDPRKSHADISKAREILGYEPLIKFPEAMELTAQWWINGCPTAWDSTFKL